MRQTHFFREAISDHWSKGLADTCSRLALVLSVAAVSCLAQPAVAQAASQTVSISAGPLDIALLELANSTGISVFVPPALAAGKTAPSIGGTMTPDQALRSLLRGSGLSYNRSSDGAYVIVNAQPRKTAVAFMPAAPQVEPQATAIAPPPAAADDTVGEIIVTAQRRSENLQDTPVAVTAVTAATVQNLGLSNIADIAAITPGASFTTNNNFFAPYIRGIGTNFVTVGIESPVAVYEDGAYLTRTLGINEILDNFDISNIQVLRGPQGTLYGRNATGGVILINSADPTSDFEGRVRGEFGNLEHRQLDAMINVPLAEDLSLRATGGYKHDDGFVHNINTGQDHGGGRAYSARAKLRWTPGNADIILGGQYYNTRYLLSLPRLARNDSTCLGCVLSPGIVPNSLGFYDLPGNPTVVPLKTKYYGANLSMAFDFDQFTLKSVTTFRRQVSIDSAGDTDLTPLPLFEFATPRSGGTSYTQDLQVSSKLDGPFNYLFGVSYLHDRGYFDSRRLGDPALLVPGVPSRTLNVETAPGLDNVAKTTSYAAFIEGYYALTDTLKATVGGRYTYEERSAEGRPILVGGIPGAAFDLNVAQKAFTPRFVLAWDNGPTNVYYSFTRGFKAGGFPGPFNALTTPVDAEKIFSHEVGLKQRLFDNRLRLNIAAFYFKNKGLQVLTLDLNSGGSRTANAGALENYGIEAEAQVTPAEGLNFALSGAWQHARYRPFENASVTCVNPGAVAPAPVLGAGCFADLTGTAPPHSPNWSGSFNANYKFAVASWTASLSGIAQYRSSIKYSPGAGGPLGYDQDGERFLVNASGYISPAGDKLRVGFYANNLFDKKYVSFRQTGAPYGLYYNAAKPRTYGLRIEYAY